MYKICIYNIMLCYNKKDVLTLVDIVNMICSHSIYSKCTNS